MPRTLIIDGVDVFETFGLWVGNPQALKSAARDSEIITIPGRSGGYPQDRGAFKNVQIKYNFYAQDGAPARIDALRNLLFSAVRGYDSYYRIVDNMYPDVFRLGIARAEIDPALSDGHKTASLSVVFDCRPERFLTSDYDGAVSVSGSVVLSAPAGYGSQEARPLISMSGAGTVTIDGIYAINSTAAADIDCDSHVINSSGTVTVQALNSLGEWQVAPRYPQIRDGSTVSASGCTASVFCRWWKL